MTIPSSYLTPGSDYIISVTVMNWLMSVSLPSTRAIHISLYSLPTLIANGPLSSYRTSIITITPSLVFPSCSPSTPLYWLWSWNIIKAVPQQASGNPSIIPVTILPSSSISHSRNLIIPSNTLSGGFDYTFMVNATTSGGSMTSGSVWSVITITITPSILIAIINDGNRVVPITLPLLLDASLSYDPDLSTSGATSGSSSGSAGNGGANGLSYQWLCYMSSTNLNCAWPSMGVSLANLTQSSLIIPSNMLIPSTSYVIGIQVTSIYDPLRSSVTWVTITTSEVVLPSKPILSVTIVSSTPSIGISQGYYLTDNILRLRASVVMLQGTSIGSIFTYEWSELNGLDLSNRLSPINSASLVLPSNSLSNGRTYTFHVLANMVLSSSSSSTSGTSSGAVLSTSYAELTLSTSLPPSSSQLLPLTITPMVGGISLSTLFTFTLNGFTGDFEPFIYSFKQVNNIDGNHIIYTVIISYHPTIYKYHSCHYYIL